MASDPSPTDNVQESNDNVINPNNSNDSKRGRSTSRKRQLSSNSSESMKPPSTRQRSVSLSRNITDKSSSSQNKPVTFKTQGESFNMSSLVLTTVTQPDIIKSIGTTVVQEIKHELISELKSDLQAIISEAVKTAISPLQHVVDDQKQKIQNLETENEKLKQYVDDKIDDIDTRYERFRTMATASANLLYETKRANADIATLKSEGNDMRSEIEMLKGENTSLKTENSSLRDSIEELEQYGRRTSLRFHNVPITPRQLQDTDNIIVDIVNNKIKLQPNITVDDINRSHIIGEIRDGKAQLICRFNNWKIKNSIYTSKKKLKNNRPNIFITEDLTKVRQALIKKLYHCRRQSKIQSFWTSDGRIFAVKGEGSPKVIIKTDQDIESIAEQ